MILTTLEFPLTTPGRRCRRRACPVACDRVRWTHCAARWSGSRTQAEYMSLWPWGRTSTVSEELNGLLCPPENRSGGERRNRRGGGMREVHMRINDITDWTLCSRWSTWGSEPPREQQMARGSHYDRRLYKVIYSLRLWLPKGKTLHSNLQVCVWVFLSLSRLQHANLMVEKILTDSQWKSLTQGHSSFGNPATRHHLALWF